MSLNKDIVFNHQSILAQIRTCSKCDPVTSISSFNSTKHFQSCKIPFLTGEIIALSPTKDIQLVPVGFHLILPG